MSHAKGIAGHSLIVLDHHLSSDGVVGVVHGMQRTGHQCRLPFAEDFFVRVFGVAGLVSRRSPAGDRNPSTAPVTGSPRGRGGGLFLTCARLSAVGDSWCRCPGGPLGGAGALRARRCAWFPTRRPPPAGRRSTARDADVPVARSASFRWLRTQSRNCCTSAPVRRRVSPAARFPSRSGPKAIRRKCSTLCPTRASTRRISRLRPSVSTISSSAPRAWRPRARSSATRAHTLGQVHPFPQLLQRLRRGKPQHRVRGTSWESRSGDASASWPDRHRWSRESALHSIGPDGRR